MLANKINLLIPGAGRSGTTAVRAYLSQHKDIYFCWAKEPSYFDRNFDLGEEWYEKLFTPAKSYRYMGEASTNYMWYPDSPKRILEYNSDMRFVFCLREPVSRAYSEYHRRIQKNGEDRTFTQLLMETNLLKKRSGYFSSLQRYTDHFPRQQMYFLVFERLIQDPISEIEKVCTFLDLPYESGSTFKVRPKKDNSSSRPISMALQRKRDLFRSDLRDSRTRFLLKAGVRKLIDKGNHIVQLKPLPRITKEEFKLARKVLEEDIYSTRELIGDSITEWDAEK